MKTLLVCAVLVLGSAGLASDPSGVYYSQGALVGALEGVFGSVSPISSPQYIPGYGLHIALKGFDGQEVQARQGIPDVLERLSTQISGLAADDWISVGFIAGFDAGRTDLLIRMRQGKPETLEVISNIPR